MYEKVPSKTHFAQEQEFDLLPRRVSVCVSRMCVCMCVCVCVCRSKNQIFCLTGHKDTVGSLACQGVDPQIISGLGLRV
jgi:hypothetical protein